MPSFFGGVTGKTSATLFEIRLDNEIIVLRGGETEASSQVLRGVVVLCIPATLKVEDVHLRMTGQLKIGWTDQRITSAGVGSNGVKHSKEIFSYRWAPFVGGGAGSSSKGSVLHTGNYEWPFELVIPGAMAESVEGLHDNNITYKLKATVARGKLAYDLHAWKPIRIVRTLDPSALELAHAMTVENIWPNKVEYQLVIPQKAIIFGTAVDLEMRFTSLLKGLHIGAITCQLIETHEFEIKGAMGQTDRGWKYAREINTCRFELTEDDYHDILDENGQDGWTTKQKIALPKTLSRCLQDVDVHGIKIRHKVKFNIALHNPDGHVSELRASLPVTIFLSPNMPLSADGRLVDQTPMSTQSQDIGNHAPPLYGEHILDQLYADVDLNGMMTPSVQSGMNTPFYSQSRAGSSENLAAINGNSQSDSAVQPAALSSRLQNLTFASRNGSHRRLHPGSVSGTSTPHPIQESDEAGYLEHHASGSGPSSTPLSRRVSQEEHPSNLTSGQHSPEHIDYTELGDLTKVPSYRTAVKMPVRGMSYNNNLPNYDTAISAPPSPNRAFSSMSTSSPDQHSYSGSSLSSMGFMSGHPPAAALMGDNDERRRLHILQNRGRA